MPLYTFKCKKCSALEKIDISIKEFRAMQSKNIDCKLCGIGYMKYMLGIPQVSIDKDAQTIAFEMKDEVSKIVEKIKAGDEETIRDIYGEAKNPLKK